MVVAPGEQRSACWRAQCGRMEARIAQALCGKLLHIRRRYSAAECAELAEAGIVKQDQQDVRCVFWRTDDLRKGCWIGVLKRAADLALEAEVRPRQRQRASRESRRRALRECGTR